MELQDALSGNALRYVTRITWSFLRLVTYVTYYIPIRNECRWAPRWPIFNTQLMLEKEREHRPPGRKRVVPSRRGVTVCVLVVGSFFFFCCYCCWQTRDFLLLSRLLVANCLLLEMLLLSWLGTNCQLLDDDQNLI